MFCKTVIHNPRILPNCVYLEDSQCYFYPLMRFPLFIVIHYVLSLEQIAFEIEIAPLGMLTLSMSYFLMQTICYNLSGVAVL